MVLLAQGGDTFLIALITDHASFRRFVCMAPEELKNSFADLSTFEAKNGVRFEPCPEYLSGPL